MALGELVTRPLGPRWSLYALAAVIVVYGIGRWQGAASVADATAVQDAETALAAGKAYRARIAKLATIEQQHLQTAQRARRIADSLRQIAQRVDTVQLSADTSLKVTWRQVADAEHQSASQCFISLAACQQRASTAEARAAGLDSLAVLVTKNARFRIAFLSLPKPPKWLTALGGCTIGGYLDHGDRVRGCAAGAAGVTIAVPTR